jgi:hypothetical protein
MRRLKKSIVPKTVIRDKINTVRNVQVMLDEDLARLYGVETKVLNQALKRNLNRFPLNLRSQIVTFNNKVGRKYLPYVFTEQGVAMLSAVLKSETAVSNVIPKQKIFFEGQVFDAHKFVVS